MIKANNDALTRDGCQAVADTGIGFTGSGKRYGFFFNFDISSHERVCFEEFDQITERGNTLILELLSQPAGFESGGANELC